MTRRSAEATAREQADRQDGLTVAKALRQYVEKKRRAKDGLPLKARTKADYLAMIEPGRTSKTGKQFADGELYAIAEKLLSKLTADDIRGVHTALMKISQRQSHRPGSPPTTTASSCLPGAEVARSTATSATAMSPSRSVMSTAKWASSCCETRRTGATTSCCCLDRRWRSRSCTAPARSPRPRCFWRRAEAHAEPRAGGDVTLGHYVGKSEAQLRSAWHTMADFIEAAAAVEADPASPPPVRTRGHHARRRLGKASAPPKYDAKVVIGQ